MTWLDRSNHWLERARIQEDPGLKVAAGDPYLDRLHGDPRWKPFMKKANPPVE